MTNEDLHLRNPKTFNEKIQWLKIYDCTPLKTRLTDKVLVRDWVKEKIGEEYLKPVLWVGKQFDDIPFDILPQKFMIKANNGCKWHFKIKNKDDFIKNKVVVNVVKKRFDGWMKQTFFPYAGFEMQYKDIEPQILIEPLLIDDVNPIEYEIYCFNGKPKIYQKIVYSLPPLCSVYNEDYSESDIVFNLMYSKKYEPAQEILKEAVEKSKILANGFKLVRVDWLLYNQKVYFNEMTFTPFSGYCKMDKNVNLKLGKMLKI